MDTDEDAGRLGHVTAKDLNYSYCSDYGTFTVFVERTIVKANLNINRVESILLKLQFKHNNLI